METASLLRSSMPVEASGTDSVDVLLLALIALAPAIFALMTWDTGSHMDPAQAALGFLSLPITLIQLLVIGIATVRGFRPIRMLAVAPSWAQAALLALVLIAFGTAVLVAVRPGFALYRTGLDVVHLLFGLAAAHLFATGWKDLRPFVWPAIVAGTCAYVFTLIVFVASIADPQSFNWERFGLGVINIRQTGFHSAIGASAALGLAAFATGRRSYILATAAASLLLGLAFWSGTRSALIAVLGACVLAWFFLPAVRTRRAWGALLISLTAGALISLFHTPPSPLYGLVRMLLSLGMETPDEISSGRIVMWIGSIHAIAERPLFGFGEGQFQFVVPESLGIFNHPHNFVLQALLHWGMAGALCLFAPGLLLWRRFHRGALQSPSSDAPAFLVAYAMLIFALVEGAFYHPYPIMMTIVALAFVLSGGKAGQSAKLQAGGALSPAGA